MLLVIEAVNKNSGRQNLFQMMTSYDDDDAMEMEDDER